MTTPEEYPLLRSQSALLAQALRLVARDGHSWWQYQTTPTEKAPVALRRLDEKWAVLLDRAARNVRRRARLPVVHALLAPVSVMPPENPPPTWPLLLLADRKLPGENLRRVNDPSPLTWVAWRGGEWRPTYVLKRDPRGALTWYLTDDFYREMLEEALHYAARGDWPRLVGHMTTLGHLPMFRGVWGQLQGIRKRVKDVWGDRHLRSPGGGWEEPPWKAAFREWPTSPLSPIGMRLYPEEPPRTLGEWMAMRRSG